jgi:hypothetical protein
LAALALAVPALAVVALLASAPVAVRGLHVGLFAPYVALLPSDSCPQSAPDDIRSTMAVLDSRRTSRYEADE